MSILNHLLGDEKHQAGEPAQAEAQAADVIISPDTRRANRIPPIQSRTRKWPVLDAYGSPNIDLANWRLEIFGLVEHPLSLTLDELKRLPQVKVFADFHCVTRWSRLGNVWEGVSPLVIADRVKIQPEARFVVAHAYDNGWTTNMPLDYFLAEDSLLTHTHDGQPISLEHGGPVRLMIPQLYAWKSAKWIRGLEFLRGDKAGFWEDGGYHMLGDPWREQRFRWD